MDANIQSFAITEAKTPRVTKEAKAIEIMKANAHLNMHEVKPLIAAAIGVDLDRAQHYYWYLSRRKLAPGVFIKKPMGRPAQNASTGKVTVESGSTKVTVETTPAKPAAPPKKTPEELQAVKDAAKARLIAHNKKREEEAAAKKVSKVSKEEKAA